MKENEEFEVPKKLLLSLNPQARSSNDEYKILRGLLSEAVEHLSRLVSDEPIGTYKWLQYRRDARARLDTPIGEHINNHE